ncbi:hypothetical protein [Kibdelosporangium aridum]|uniref:Uncharacterized protein n=1 Tax=Kibdelosporangium aridum TaxID=2030 RepID=A0A1W2FZM9_KIBAR|nr:hypothetical protein [Kibdelosporangium aridum]SMD27172.1 hypothetical protein SAMN05661093_10769 [Kibdelosporangium aridum]
MALDWNRIGSSTPQLLVRPALAEAYGRYHEAAVLLGASSRLRGAHDRTNRQIRELTGRGRATLGDELFAAGYGKAGSWTERQL